MKTIKDVKFEEVIEYFDREHPIRSEGNFTTNGWARGLLLSTNELCGGKWKIVELTPEEILEIFLPHHQGEPHLGGIITLIDGEGATTKDAIKRFSGLSDYKTTNTACWEKIHYWNDKKIEPIFLSTVKPKHMKDRDVKAKSD